jgi:3-hydroxyisobutyrate dehydrogenase-like beta-hydroxyacid dehydrogenase
MTLYEEQAETPSCVGRISFTLTSVGHRVPWQWRDDGVLKSAMTIIAKDIGIVMDEARLSSFPAPLSSVAEQVFTAALGADLARVDDGNVIKLWERFGVPSSMDAGSEEEAKEKAKELVVEAGTVAQKVLVVGLGVMGLPMALSLVKAGINVVGYDVSLQALDAFSTQGGKTTSDVLVESKDADVVLLATVSAAHAESVLFGADGKSGIAKGESYLEQSDTRIAAGRNRDPHLDRFSSRRD